MQLHFSKKIPVSIHPVMQIANRLNCGARLALHRIERWLEVRRDRRILLGMNDQQLKDIGISRSQAERAIRSGR